MKGCMRPMSPPHTSQQQLQSVGQRRGIHLQAQTALQQLAEHGERQARFPVAPGNGSLVALHYLKCARLKCIKPRP